MSILVKISFWPCRHFENLHYKAFLIKNWILICSTDLGTPIQTFIVVHIMLLLKNTQFLRNDYEKWSKLSTQEYLILTKYHNHCVKIVDFLLKAYFLIVLWSLDWAVQVCMILKQTFEPDLRQRFPKCGVWTGPKAGHYQNAQSATDLPLTLNKIRV